LRLTYSKYKNQKAPEVYQNDSLSTTTAVRNKFEHTYGGQPASLLFDIEYSAINKDWRATHSHSFYSKSLTKIIGEQLSIISLGETTLKFKQSNYSDQSTIANYKSVSFSLDQYLNLLEGQQLLIGSLELTQLNYFEEPILSNNTYLARLIYLNFELIPTYTFQVNLTLIVTDTKAQKETRGSEVNFNPSINIAKSLTEKIKLALDFNSTNYSSKQEAYKYKRQILALELNYTF
jgi:hypothetical protein